MTAPTEAVSNADLYDILCHLEGAATTCADPSIPAPLPIQDVLDAFVKARPKLAATSSGGATPPPGDPGRGPRGGDQPAQLTDADLKRMTPEQIVEARRAGRLSALLGGR